MNNRQGADSILRCHLTSIGNPIVEIRRSYDRLISTMGFPILVRRHLYIEWGPTTHGIVLISWLCKTCDVKHDGKAESLKHQWVNILRATQFCYYFANDIFIRIFLTENGWISLKTSLMFILMFELTTFQHWFRKCFGAHKVTRSHYLNQSWLAYWRIYASFCLNEIIL